MFKLIDYIVTPKDLWNFFRKVFAVGKKSSKRDAVGGVLIIILTLAMVFFLHFTFQGIFFWLFFFVLIFWKLDARISIGLALFGFVIIMILNAMSNANVDFVSGWDETVAVWVYFFLVIGVVKQILEYRAESKSQPEKIVVDVEGQDPDIEKIEKLLDKIPSRVPYQSRKIIRRKMDIRKF